MINNNVVHVQARHTDAIVIYILTDVLFSEPANCLSYLTDQMVLLLLLLSLL